MFPEEANLGTEKPSVKIHLRLGVLFPAAKTQGRRGAGEVNWGKAVS